jgi:hypothetical protein
MRRDHDVEQVRVAGKDLQARLRELGAHEHRQDPTHEARYEGEHQVHRPDVLVVGRISPASPTARRAVLCRMQGQAGGNDVHGGMSDRPVRPHHRGATGTSRAISC